MTKKRKEEENIKKKEKKKINKYLDIFIHLVGYTLVLITVSVLFKNIVYVDNQYYGLWGFLAVLIIFIANRLVKQLLFWLTLPLTALTLGLFYPLINVFILKIADWCLFCHFEMNGIISVFLVSIIISIMNAIMDNLIIDTFLRRFKK